MARLAHLITDRAVETALHGESPGHVDTLDKVTDARTIMVETLLDAMESLPANPSVAMRVLWLADGSRTDAAALANAIESDPGLTARVLRLANSVYYSPGGAVSNVARAVVNVGFGSVKALATAALTGLDTAPELPHHFWEHAAQVAHASSLAARHFGAPAKDTFALGLLHDVGEGLLCMVDARTWRSIETDTPAVTTERLDAEISAFGMTHAEVAGRVLEAWKLPVDLHQTISDHHALLSPPRWQPDYEPDENPSALTLALAAGEAIAELFCDRPDARRSARLRRELERSGMADDFVLRIGRRMSAESAGLTEAFRS